MEKLIDILGVLIVFILGGGIFYFLSKDKTSEIILPKPPTEDELNAIRKDKENELLNQNPDTFIDNNLDNADMVNDVKRTSDDRFDDILDKHRKRKNLD